MATTHTINVKHGEKILLNPPSDSDESLIIGAVGAPEGAMEDDKIFLHLTPGNTRELRDHLDVILGGKGIDAGSAVVKTHVYGELLPSGDKLTGAHIALKIGTEGGHMLLTGGRDELIELGSRIIQEATIAELRREGAFKR